MSRLIAAGRSWPGSSARLRLRNFLVACLPLAIITIVPTAASAQVVYTIQKSAHVYQPLGAGATSHTPVDTSGWVSPDGGQLHNLPLPFPVDFFGVTYNQITVAANGFVSFTDNTEYEHYADPLMNSDTPNAVVAPFWSDLECPTIKTQLLPTTPAEFVIQWHCSEWDWLLPTGTKTVQFQLALREGDPTIEARYGTIYTAAAWNGSAGMGIEDQTGTQRFIPIGARGVVCNDTCNQADFPTNSKIVYGRDADLRVPLVATPAKAWGGLPIHIEAQIGNAGGKPAANFDVRFLLSSDTTPDAGDIVLGTFPGPTTLAPAQQTTVVVDPIVPSSVPAGRYFVLAESDPGNVVVEGFENNNVGVSTAVEVGVPTPDLRVESILVPTEPQLDGNLRFSWTVANDGAAEAVDVPYTIIVSENDYVSTADLTLFTGTLRVAGLSSLPIEEVVPLPPSLIAGARHVGVIIDPDDGQVESNETNNIGISEETVLLGSTDLTAVTTSLPAAEVGSHYCRLLEAGGGDGRYVWTLNSGMLPPGITLDEERAGGDMAEPPLATMLCGEPWQVGSYEFTLRVTSAGLSAVQDYDLVVAETGMPLTTGTYLLRDAVAREPYEEELLAVGGTPPYVWSVVGGALPPGIELHGNGDLRGTPTTSGTYPFEASVTDLPGGTATIALELHVGAPKQITCMTTTLPSRLLDESYDETLQVAGGTAPYTWRTLESQRLVTSFDPGENYQDRPPAGLTMSSDGHVSGTPQKAGDYLWRVQVSGSDSSRVSVCSLRFSVAYEQGISITTTALGHAYADAPYAVELDVSGGKPPYVWSIGPDSELPPGMSLDPEGELHGVLPLSLLGTETAMTFPFSVRVEDAQNRIAVAPLSIALRATDDTDAGKSRPKKDDGGCAAAGGDPGLLVLGVGLGLLFLRRRG